MHRHDVQMQRTLEFALIPRLLIAFGAGLVLGELGVILAWNRLDNPWPYLGLLCPFVLGIIGAMTVGIHTRRSFSRTLSVCTLAWIGFYITFIVIAWRTNPYHFGGPPPPELYPDDCSPCFDFGDILLVPTLTIFFPIGLLFVTFVASITNRVLKIVWSTWMKSYLQWLRSIQLPLFWLALLAAVLVLFPFDWLSDVWPAYAQIFDLIFATALAHEIGHATLFLLAGLLVLCSIPRLRKHPLFYTLIMLCGALNEEFIQAISRWKMPNLGDGRDISLDILGFALAYVLVWMWSRLRITQLKGT